MEGNAMIRSSTLVVLLLLITPLAAHPSSNQIKHVIYITLDGVRWQDVFIDRKHFRLFWQKYARNSEIYGDPQSGRRIEVASIPISLPSYQSQLSGKVQPHQCHHNECGRITMETFAEALIHRGYYQRHEVATFASWELINLALESIADTTYSNIGTQPAYDPLTNEADDIMSAINSEQTRDIVRRDCRRDEHTFELAIHYYQKYQPAFLWISLGNADIFAHRANREAYDNTLKYYDLAIDQLMQLLSELNILNETMIIITTDHGRGNGDRWTDHGADLPESKQIWAFVINGKLLASNTDGINEFYSTLSFRPTIENALTPK